MPLCTIKNNLSSKLAVPPPVAKTLAAGATITKVLTVDEIEDPALRSLVADGHLSITATNDPDTPDSLEGALRVATIAKVSKTITHADLVDADNGDSLAVNIGDPLPANAVVIGHSIVSNVGFSGGGATSLVMDLGGTDADGIVAALEMITDAPTGAEKVAALGLLPVGGYGGQQLAATFDPDAGHNLTDLTAGSVTIEVYYVVVA